MTHNALLCEFNIYTKTFRKVSEEFIRTTQCLAADPETVLDGALRQSCTSLCDNSRPMHTYKLKLITIDNISLGVVRFICMHCGTAYPYHITKSGSIPKIDAIEHSKNFEEIRVELGIHSSDLAMETFNKISAQKNLLLLPENDY